MLQLPPIAQTVSFSSHFTPVHWLCDAYWLRYHQHPRLFATSHSLPVMRADLPWLVGWLVGSFCCLYIIIAVCCIILSVIHSFIDCESRPFPSVDVEEIVLRCGCRDDEYLYTEVEWVDCTLELMQPILSWISRHEFRITAQDKRPEVLLSCAVIQNERIYIQRKCWLVFEYLISDSSSFSYRLSSVIIIMPLYIAYTTQQKTTFIRIVVAWNWYCSHWPGAKSELHFQYYTIFDPHLPCRIPLCFW